MTKKIFNKISGKTGEGVVDLLNDLVIKVPSAKDSHWTKDRDGFSRALIFDSFYDDHKGIVAVDNVVPITNGPSGSKDFRRYEPLVELGHLPVDDLFALFDS